MKKQLQNIKHSFLHGLVVFIALIGSLQVNGQSLVEFNASAIPTGSPVNLPVAAGFPVANMTSTAITRVGCAITSGSAVFPSNLWPISPAVAPTSNKYLTFTLTANSGYRLNLNGATFTYDLQRTGTGPVNAYLYTSAGGFNAGNAISTTTVAVANAVTSMSVTFSGAAFDGRTSIEIRIYADGATANSGVLRLKDPVSGSGNIRITGGSVVSCKPIISAISSNTPLCAGSTLNLTSTATSAVTPITYSWMGPNAFTSTSQNPTLAAVTVAAAGTYTLNATNSCGTSIIPGTTTVVVHSVSIPGGSHSDLLCNGDVNGHADISAAIGGSAPYTYDWTPGNPTGDGTTGVTGLTAGTYTCTATDANGCSANQTFTVTQPTAIASTNSSSNISCNGGNNGSASVSISGGTPTYSYAWSPSGGSSASASSLTSGSYTCTVTDANGCFSNQTFILTQPFAISLSSSSVNETCPSSCDGTATVVASGGTGPYNYSWTPIGSGSTLTGCCTGTYTCNVTDANGCTASTTVAVNSNNCSGTTQLIQNYTNQQMSNWIYITPLTGATNYEYTFSLGATLVSTVQRGNTSFYLPLAWANIAYGNTYNVRVRGFVNGVWGSFGPIRTVNLQPTIPLTQLNSGSCGATNLTLGSTININGVSGATNYRYTFTDLSTSAVINYVRGNNSSYVNLVWVAGLQYGHSYSVQVGSFVGGAWSAYGSPCNISMQSSIPTTSLTSAYCNMSVPGTSSTVACTYVYGATDYYYEFTDVSTSIVSACARGNSNTSIPLNWANPLLTANHTYSVKVASLVGGVWSAYGTSCTVFVGGARLANPDPSAQQITSENIDFTASLYPNPIVSNTAPTVRINDADGQNAVVRVLDITGKEVTAYEIEVVGQEFQTTLNDFPALSSGMYFMTITIQNKVENLKFVVE